VRGADPLLDAAVKHLTVLPDIGSKRIADVALAATSGITLRNMLGVPHEASLMTVHIKTGLALGFIRTQ
jgi:hypothetical protein